MKSAGLTTKQLKNQLTKHMHIIKTGKMSYCFIESRSKISTSICESMYTLAAAPMPSYSAQQI